MIFSNNSQVVSQMLDVCRSTPEITMCGYASVNRQMVPTVTYYIVYLIKIKQ